MADQYPDAGKKASPEVQKIINDFKKGDKKHEVLLYHILGDGTPPYKMSKPEAKYADVSTVKGQTCGNCEYAYLKIANKKYICSQMRGRIETKAWCRLWKPAKK